MAHQQALQLARARDHLYTHGYIARMLEAREAPSYFTRLLQFDEHLLQLYITPESMAFFIIGPAVQHARHTMTISDRRAWLLDYKVRDYGTVVPQGIWTPATPGDAQRYCKELKMPIFFVYGDYKTLGIRLTDAADGRCAGLLNGHAPAPVGSCHTANIRVNWPGYQERSSQIMTRDQSQGHYTISIETLAARVARVVRKILDFLPNQPCQRPSWRVGGQDGVTANDVILIGLIQVSQGSWQPILQLSRYIITP